MPDEDALNIYTDRSSFSGPRVGGIGIVFVIINDAGGEEVVNEFVYPGYRQATNNEMELEACIKGLEEALDQKALQQSGSIYCVVLLTCHCKRLPHLAKYRHREYRKFSAPLKRGGLLCRCGDSLTGARSRTDPLCAFSSYGPLPYNSQSTAL